MTAIHGSPIIIGMEGVRRCPVCGDPLGVYESLVAIGPGSARSTSLAREPQPPGGETIVHRACAPDGIVLFSGSSGC